MLHLGSAATAGMMDAMSMAALRRAVPLVDTLLWSMILPFGLTWAITSTQSSAAALGLEFPRVKYEPGGRRKLHFN